MTNPSPPHRPDIHVLPPVVFMAGFALAYTAHGIVAVRIAGDPAARSTLAWTGLGFIGVGLALALWGIVTFRRARTTMFPFRPASALVRDGPYAFSRNPMYIGMTLGYLGLSMVFNTLWPIMVLPVVLWALVKLVISREEAYLEAVFGDEYRAYRRDVRRWL